MENNLVTNAIANAYTQPVDCKDQSSYLYAFTVVLSMPTATVVDCVNGVLIKRERAYMKHKAAQSLDHTQS